MQGARQSDVFFGTREQGQDVRTANVTAVQAVANIVKSSLGPVGLDKVRFSFRSARFWIRFDLPLFGQRERRDESFCLRVILSGQSRKVERDFERLREIKRESAKARLFLFRVYIVDRDIPLCLLIF